MPAEPAKGGGRQIKKLVSVPVFPIKRTELSTTLKEEVR